MVDITYNQGTVSATKEDIIKSSIEQLEKAVGFDKKDKSYMKQLQRIEGRFVFTEYPTTHGDAPSILFGMEIDGEKIGIGNPLLKGGEWNIISELLDQLCREQEKSLLKKRLDDIDTNSRGKNG